MSLTQRIEVWLQSNLFKHLKLVTQTNRDYPYHDYHVFYQETGDAVWLQWNIGEDNLNAHGDQKKMFVSKRLILWSATALLFKLNSMNNVTITAKPIYYFDGSEAANAYEIEIHTNVSTVFVYAASEGEYFGYAEGVLPQETRDAE